MIVIALNSLSGNLTAVTSINFKTQSLFPKKIDRKNKNKKKKTNVASQKKYF